MINILLGGLLLLLSAGPTQAQSTGWLQNPDHPPVQVRLSQAGHFDAASRHYPALLEVALDDDWKTYWRSPGEGGIAPRIDWQGSENLAAVNWQWPTPERFMLLGVETQGYQGEVAFPLQLTPEDPNRPIHLNATLTLPSCTTICVLTDYRLQLALTPDEIMDSLQYAYQKALAQVPGPARLVSLERLLWDKSRKQLQLSLIGPRDWQQPAVFIDELDTSMFTRPQVTLSGDRLNARFTVSSWDEALNLAGASLTVTVADQGFAEALSGTVEAAAVLPAEPPFSLAQALLYALLGGLILNIMPCVLPVLGLKLNSLLLRTRHPRQVRRPLLLSATGILLSFWGLAGFMLLLTWSGASLGWGIQFQQPGFIAFMLLVTSLFAFNLLGLFTIRLPHRLNTWLATHSYGGDAGHLLQGSFATLLATPCSAPFLGTAVAVALASSPPVLFAIFTGLGLGMALPWLLLALFPGLTRAMPRPGRWMLWVKALFGLMLLATSLWLLSLLSPHLGLNASLLLATILLLLPLLSALRHHGIKGLLICLSAGSLLVAGGGLVALLTQPYWVNPVKDELTWEPLDAGRIEQQVAEGKRVFIDITADWCITCQANKIGVLLQEPVYSALQDEDLLLMRGDWTRPDSRVTDYLRAHGRAGIPFNQVFGPGSPDGQALEVLLTTERVMSALDAAR
ncbi:protein-disulfide reductase DsbD family protein [Zobellella maritima]|uniref:protein-disulfide reductase DsbD family protein n=1 Tax=Zobellella maritima TaxID=2059725 RepID=UPI000E3049DF|nr:protein-disulfide reductase DsbD domain-containing protein [Zobellella maritima]